MNKTSLSLALVLVLAIGACSEWRVVEPETGAIVGADQNDLNAAPEPTAGNNLSYPVIWAEGVTKDLRTPPVGMDYVLDGEWWYWWGMEGVDPDITPLSCPPDPDNNSLCDDGIPMQANGTPPGNGWVKAYLQKDPLNIWQAESADWSASPVSVNWVDWGDNLESVDWYTRSQIRTEIVLFQDLNPPMREYEMRHVSGWGIDEVHGVAGAGSPNAPLLGPGQQGTVYSNCARLTIQRLLVDRGDPQLADLIWVPGEGWVAPGGVNGVINPPMFNMAVYEGGDGPGYYSAEINVKGRIIYGYTWNVRKLNEGAGDYRLTFSFDEQCGGVSLNTYFTEGITQLLLPVEETLKEEPDLGGGTPALDFANNLTYIDITILQRTGGGRGGRDIEDSPGGGGGGGGGGHGGGGNH